jgi:hypothetical protein
MLTYPSSFRPPPPPRLLSFTTDYAQDKRHVEGDLENVSFSSVVNYTFELHSVLLTLAPTLS